MHINCEDSTCAGAPIDSVDEISSVGVTALSDSANADVFFIGDVAGHKSYLKKLWNIDED